MFNFSKTDELGSFPTSFISIVRIFGDGVYSVLLDTALRVRFRLGFYFQNYYFSGVLAVPKQFTIRIMYVFDISKKIFQSFFPISDRWFYILLLVDGIDLSEMSCLRT